MQILDGNKTITYDYNDQGLRTSKTITGDGIFPSSRYFYDGTKLITDYSSDRRLDFLYDENDRLYGFVLNEVDTYFYVRDTLENILGIIDSSGNLVVKYTYNAWGKIQSIIGSKASTIGKYNPFRYKGYYYDNETGMYYCHTRYYVPEWCRWLCADHSSYLETNNVKNANIFVYCQNDPINKVDPSGGFWLIASILVLTTVIGATIGGIKAHKKAKEEGSAGKDLAWQTIKGALIGGAFGLATGGAIIATGAVVAGAMGVTAIAGMSVIKIFAIGALAFDFAAFFVAPLMGVKMDGLEIGTLPASTQKTGIENSSFIRHNVNDLVVKY